eukprot:COSAG01_NODE_51242_length_356_cov_1.000000_1_plen_68_part_01
MKYAGRGSFDFCNVQEPLRILVAGCGTGNTMVQAITGAMLATMDCDHEPPWQVVCADLLTASLADARQ